MIRASHLDTSRTSPVAFLTNSCPSPAKSDGTVTSLAIQSSGARLAVPRTAGISWVRGRRGATLSMATVNRSGR